MNTVLPAFLPVTEGSLERRNWNALQLPLYGILDALDRAMVPSFHDPFRLGRGRSLGKRHLGFRVDGKVV